jgi:Calcineurin-like phosphoesterase
LVKPIRFCLVCVGLAWVGVAAGAKIAIAQSTPSPLWSFAVSGDSRNCGDVVMPAIAAGVKKSQARFYWHLGDYRAIYDFDEDMVAPATLGLNQPHMTISSYLTGAWPDFIKNQLGPFGDMKVFLGIGNHETIPPKTHEDYLIQFGSYLNNPTVWKQREEDQDTAGGMRAYYHWTMDGVDFITLDNATDSTFDPDQMKWIRSRIAADRDSTAIKTVVVGMHEALPGSVGLSHSMCDSSDGVATGREVYQLLLNLQAAGKHVYVLASHSHFVVEDVYNTPYWKGQVLPGWIVGTAGAVRYRLPESAKTGKLEKTDVYGYLVGTVMSDGSVGFEFKELGLEDLRSANGGKAPDAVVSWCFKENKDLRIPKPEACGAER